jgi:DNA-binding response OmpR family regulator
MPASAVRILIIGPLAEATGEMSQRLERRGWATHAVATLREAQIVLRTIRFPLVLASEKLDDGTGYELTKWATEQELTLMVGLQLTDTLLWLPVVEAGERSLGSRALNPIMLEGEIENLMTRTDEARTRTARERTAKIATGSVLKGELADGIRGQKGAMDSKTLMPPMRGTRKFPTEITADRVAGTHGKQ